MPRWKENSFASIGAFPLFEALLLILRSNYKSNLTFKKSLFSYINSLPFFKDQFKYLFFLKSFQIPSGGENSYLFWVPIMAYAYSP